jgi:hypothetical protein
MKAVSTNLSPGRTGVFEAMSPPEPSADLKGLLEAYERSLILAALGAVGGRQRSAAALLRILPTTLNEKMKRLGLRNHRVQRPALPAAQQVCSTLVWTGRVRPGGTLEVRGLNGPVRIEAGPDDSIEVVAKRKGSREIFSAIEVKVVEHANGVTVCALCQAGEARGPRRLQRDLLRAVASVRVELIARVPPGVHVLARTVNDDIEVAGLATNVDAGTANGHVRFVPAGPAGAHPPDQAGLSVTDAAAAP